MMKSRLIRTAKDKRGQFIVGGMVTGYALIAIILIFLAFFLLFKINSSVRQARLNPPAMEVASNQAVIAYLRMPVEVRGFEMTMAELIALGKKNDELWETVEEKTETFLAKLSKEKECAYIFIDNSIYRSRTSCLASANEVGAHLLRTVYGLVDIFAEEELTEAFADISNHYTALIPALDASAQPIRVLLFAGVKDE